MNSNRTRGLLAALLLFPVLAHAAGLETEEQKLGYLIGMDIGNDLRQRGTPVDIEALIEALRVTFNGETPALTQEEADAVREAFIARRQAEAAAEQTALAARNKGESETFLAANAREEGVQVTASGLQYKVLKPGDGRRPAATDMVTVHYRGTLLDGTEFDSSYSRGEPASFALDRVIPGWTEGVQLMPVGSTYEFYIKPELAYGEAGGGPIPPNAALIFQVELLGVGDDGE